jgi:hypothetical protein
MPISGDLGRRTSAYAFCTNDRLDLGKLRRAKTFFQQAFRVSGRLQMRRNSWGPLSALADGQG